MRLKKIRNERYVRADILNMALEIQKYNQDKITFIGILKGGMFTMYSLLRMFSSEKYDMQVGHLGLSSYNKSTQAEGSPLVTSPLDLVKEDINGRDVWIIDDIVDSGFTISRALDIIKQYDSKSIHIAVLVDKKKKSY